MAPRLLIVSASSSPGKGFGGGDDKSSSSSSAKKGTKKDEVSERLVLFSLEQSKNAGRRLSKKTWKKYSKPLFPTEKNHEQLRQALDPRASPIDPREASRGRVDVATVKSWKGLDVSKKGASDTSALGELELKSFAPGGGEDAASSSSPSPSPSLASQPLYEALARRLSVLQASGALAEPSPASTSSKSRSVQKRKLPRFEDWRWSERRYLQFLADCLVVHAALESAIGNALGAAAGVVGGGEEATTSGSGASVSTSSLSSSSQQRLAAFAALSYLGSSSGLCRASEIAEDLDAILRTSTEWKEAASSSSGGAGKGASSPAPPPPPKPSASARATARYLFALGSRAAREVVAEVEEEKRGGSRGPPPFRGGAPGRRDKGGGDSQPPASASAALRLLANCYSLHVTHLTTGMRVGASASEALGLLTKRAAGFYQTYPDELGLAPKSPPLFPSESSASSSSVGARDNKRIVDPLRAFRSAVDGAGRVLSPPPPAAAAPSSSLTSTSTPPPQLLLLEEVEGELVRAVRRAASLFEPLASADP